MKYEFYIDRKYTEWDRAHYQIEVENEEEGKARAIEIMNQSREEEEEPAFYSHIDSLTDMSPEENGGFPTKELYSDNGEFITSNAPEKHAQIMSEIQDRFPITLQKLSDNDTHETQY